MIPFLAPIIIDFYVYKDAAIQPLRDALAEIRETTGLKVRLGSPVPATKQANIFVKEVDNRTIYIFEATDAPHGLAEVCGRRGVAYIGDTYITSTDLIRHEILHTLGASHYKGFMNDVTERVLRTIKRCVKED